jgi:CxxC motif-containing protein (DUF1111 family)
MSYTGARGFVLALSVALSGCDSLLTSEPPEDEVLAGTVPGLNGSQLAQHARGDEEFAKVFGTVDGLGPIFVAPSCESCHVGDGKGHLAFNLTRFGRSTAGGFDPMRALGGPQVQNRAIQNYLAEIVPGGVTGYAQFTAPIVTGLGYLEAVTDAALLALQDPGDSDGDGISGRVQLVDETDVVAEIGRIEDVIDGSLPPRTPVEGKLIGRFGKKASTISLLHQTVSAYHEDMGITSDLLPVDPVNRQVGGFSSDGVADPEVGSSAVEAVVFYLRTLKAPPRRNAESSDVEAGAALFAGAGCAKCHLPVMRTGPSTISALNNAEFHPYTDMLLHDMGPDLDDGYTEGRALTSEWRTAPLWGIGLAETSQGGMGFFLHDGRARSIREAIEFHGGEGASSRAAFRALSSVQQEQVLAYLRSL